jgi:ubiquinone/menaquinone biosynthesis C-methylase UbiE
MQDNRYNIMVNKFQIEGPIFIGRSCTEYLKMFNLDLQDLKDKKILDCAAGASSFTAKMTGRGYDVKAVDILYGKDPSFLQKRCKDHLIALVSALSKLEGHFVWNFFENLDELKKTRLEACRQFFEDYKNNREKYIKADLLNLPFKDNAFNVVLCSHLLFIYDHRLSYEFHINAVKEMLRVTSEDVLIHPLVRHKAIKSRYVKKVAEDLPDVDVMIERVDYEFRNGGNEMIRINKSEVT